MAARKKSSTRRVKLEKEIIGPDRVGPEERPLFVNHFQVSHASADWFLDAGVLPLDDMLSKRNTARFLVSTRFAMSPESMRKLRDQITEVLDKAENLGTSNGKPQVTR